VVVTKMCKKSFKALCWQQGTLVKSRTGVKSTFSIFSAALQVSDFTGSLLKFVCETLAPFPLPTQEIVWEVLCMDRVFLVRFTVSLYNHSVNSAHCFDFQLYPGV